jgi:hypothetical protein
MSLYEKLREFHRDHSLRRPSRAKTTRRFVVEALEQRTMLDGGGGTGIIRVGGRSTAAFSAERGVVTSDGNTTGNGGIHVGERSAAVSSAVGSQGGGGAGRGLVTSTIRVDPTGDSSSAGRGLVTTDGGGSGFGRGLITSTIALSLPACDAASKD